MPVNIDIVRKTYPYFIHNTWETRKGLPLPRRFKVFTNVRAFLFAILPPIYLIFKNCCHGRRKAPAWQVLPVISLHCMFYQFGLMVHVHAEKFVQSHSGSPDGINTICKVFLYRFFLLTQRQNFLGDPPHTPAAVFDLVLLPDIFISDQRTQSRAFTDSAL